MPRAVELEKLKQWATPRQIEVIDAIIQHETNSAAANALGIGYETVKEHLKTLRKKAALHGYSPEHDLTATIPEPLVIRGVSTLYGADGEIKQQWVKSQLDKTLVKEAIEEWVNWLVQDAKGLAPIVPAPTVSNDDLLVVYPMGDPHFGMYGWKAETGEDFDLAIAERITRAAISRLVDAAPSADTALIVELGDFFHADNNSAQTPRSGNQLDVDTRYARVLQVGLRAMVHVANAALAKHAKVIIRIVQGNHDTHSALALALALDAYFHLEPRLTVDLSPAPFWYFRFGKVLIGAAHGDTCKTDKLPSLMAYDRAEDWGQTRYRYFYHGHIHHDSVKEFPGCMVESFRTLAARDAWHTGAGYRSGRDMKMIVHHRNFGEVERHRIDIAQLEAA